MTAITGQTYVLKDDQICSPLYEKKTKTFDDLFKGPILKTAKRHASIGYEYGKSVNGRRGKEGLEKDFEAQELPWGEWVEGSKVVLISKGVFYVRISYLNANSQKGKSIFHYEDGTEITGQDLELLKADFLPVKSKSNTQGVENEVIVNSIMAKNIVEMTLNGKRYIHRCLAASEKIKKLA